MSLSPMVIRAPALFVRPSGTVDFIADAILASDHTGTITYAGAATDAPHLHQQATPLKGLIIPPFVDCHIHIPQHPIRGRFVEGIHGNPPEGRLLAGLNRNVFPTEAKASDPAWAQATVDAFYQDTLRNGVVGGAAYMTVHPTAANIALNTLPETWLVGPVLMNQNCPDYLRTDESHIAHNLDALAREFGPRMIVTDRFAVAVNTSLRTLGVNLAKKHDLRMQTHLNEQTAEKDFVERTLYPGRGTYTDVYAQDGLLDRSAIMAHCIHMSDDEFRLLRDRGACIAHCPTSNEELGSGVMDLDRVKQFGIDYAICTDVGASPTVSLIQEMQRFLKVHEERSSHATPCEALYRTTLGAAKMLKIDSRVGRLEAGRPMSFVELKSTRPIDPRQSVDQIIREHVIETSDYESKVGAVVINGKVMSGNLPAVNERSHG